MLILTHNFLYETIFVMENNQQPLPSEQQKDRSHSVSSTTSYTPSKTFIILLVILLILIVSVGGYMLGAKRNKTAQNQPLPTPIIHPSPAPLPSKASATEGVDETANWKTYTNSKHAYLIRYPNDIFVRTICPNKELILEHGMPNEARDSIEVPACGGRGGRFAIEIVTYDSQKGEKPYFDYSDYSVAEEEVIVTGIKTKKSTYSFVDKEDPESSDWFSRVLVLKGTKTYEITFGDKDFIQTFDQILSTFQFTN